MTRTIGFILEKSEITNFSFNEPTTTQSLIMECYLRNWNIFALFPENILLKNNYPEAIAYQVKLTSQCRTIVLDPVNILLKDLDVILIRQNPPVNMNYIFLTHLLEYLENSKTVVINSPSGIRKANEKLYINNFPELTPESLVSSNIGVLKDFLNDFQEIIIKPLNNFAGNGIFYLKKGDKNLNSILESATGNGSNFILAQEYLHNIKHGDKRLILLGGEPIAAINRLPNQDDFRANMCKGGYLEKCEVTENDREICARIAPKLLEDGLFFVGLDIVDNKIIEINVTSPGFFIRKINPHWNIRLEEKVIDYIEELLPIKGELSLVT